MPGVSLAHLLYRMVHRSLLGSPGGKTPEAVSNLLHFYCHLRHLLDRLAVFVLSHWQCLGQPRSNGGHGLGEVVLGLRERRRGIAEHPHVFPAVLPITGVHEGVPYDVFRPHQGLWRGCRAGCERTTYYCRPAGYTRPTVALGDTQRRTGQSPRPCDQTVRGPLIVAGRRRSRAEGPSRMTPRMFPSIRTQGMTRILTPPLGP